MTTMMRIRRKTTTRTMIANQRLSGNQTKTNRGTPIVVTAPIVLPWFNAGWRPQRGRCWNPASDLTSISRARRTEPFQLLDASPGTLIRVQIYSPR